MSEVLTAALFYARAGQHVVPIHTVADGRCSCGKLGCKSPGKHPRTANGLKDATTDEKIIRRWFTLQWPASNLAIVTGLISGIVVVDVDGEDGAESLFQLERQFGRLPETVEALTGGGGRHIVFKHPGLGIRIGNRQALAPGLDIRGDGGYIVVYPSVHASGKRYEWDAAHHPDEMPLAEMPAWLRQRLTAPPLPVVTTNGNGKRADEGRPANADLVLSGCAWLRHCIQDAASLPRDEWYAMLTLAARCEGGERLAHEWSGPYPGYTLEETSYQLRSAQASPGPRTCADIRGSLRGEGYCGTCVHSGRIRSPLALARGRLAALEEMVPPAGYGGRGDCLVPDYVPDDPDPLPAETARPFGGHRPRPGDENGAVTQGSGQAPGEGAMPEDTIPAAAAMTLEQALMTAKEACMAAREDPGLLFEQAALHALALLRRYSAQDWARLKEQVRKARVALGDLVRQFPEVQLHPSDRAAYGPAGEDEVPTGAPARLAGDLLDECPLPTLRIPEHYGLRWNAVTRTVRDQEGAETEHTLAFAPVLVTGRLRDAVGGEESLLTAWRWPGALWQSRIVGRAQLLSTRSLVLLAGIGFPVADDSAKALVGYLHRLEALNRRSLPCAAVSSHLGWQGESGRDGFLCGRTLICPDGSVEETGMLDAERPETWSEKRISFHGLGEGDEQIVGAFHARGSLETWQETVALLAPHPKALLALYASFATPLLQIFSCPNFVADWSNRTSTGKTTVLRVAASVWGSPDERAAESVIGTWDATRVWTERASHVLQSLPLILDDTKKAKTDRIVAELVYAVASGRGRGRGTISGLARTATWRTILLSTGERPATSFTQDGGTRTRVLTVRGLPFGAADTETGKLVARINGGILAHYGQAGRVYLQWLQRSREQWPEWVARYQHITEELATRPGTPEAGRLAQYMAAIYTAAEMAHRALSLEWEFGRALTDLWPSLAAEAAEASGEVRALQDIASWIYSHANTFHGRQPSDGYGAVRAGAVCSGRWDEGEQWEWVGIYPHILNEALKAAGYEPEAVLPGWKERGWLLHDAGKYTRQQRMPDGKPRLVCLTRAAVENAG